MDAKALLLDSIDERGALYGEKLELCREDFSKRAVHDLRTSIRRLLAALDVVGFVVSGSRVEKLSDRLKDQLDGFGDLRDIQVMLDAVTENVGTLPTLEPFQEYLKKREKKKQRSGERHVKDIKLGGVKKRLLKIREMLEDLSQEEVNGKLPQAADEAYLTVIQRYGEMEPKQLVSIHHLRVAFKKFRYMVEVIHHCLPAFPTSQLKRMHDYQTRMGNIHDTEVLLETLEAFAENDDSYDPDPVRRFYKRILEKALSDYLESKAEILIFWRATPLVGVPWETDQTKKEN